MMVKYCMTYNFKKGDLIDDSKGSPTSYYILNVDWGGLADVIEFSKGEATRTVIDINLLPSLIKRKVPLVIDARDYLYPFKIYREDEKIFIRLNRRELFILLDYHGDEGESYVSDRYYPDADKHIKDGLYRGDIERCKGSIILTNEDE